MAAPISAERTGNVIGGVLVTLSTAHVDHQQRDDLWLAIGIAVAVLAIGLIAAVIGARRVAGPVGALTAAATAVEKELHAGSLDPSRAARRDRASGPGLRSDGAPGARAEERMQREIKELSVQIDEAKRRKQVAEITETDYFRDLQRRQENCEGEVSARELKAPRTSGARSRGLLQCHHALGDTSDLLRDRMLGLPHAEDPTARQPHYVLREREDARDREVVVFSISARSASKS